MIFSRVKEKDLDSWIGGKVKINLHEDGFYTGILIAEQKNGIPLEASNKK